MDHQLQQLFDFGLEAQCFFGGGGHAYSPVTNKNNVREMGAEAGISSHVEQNRADGWMGGWWACPSTGPGRTN
ncbi:MAG: hypothetical protein K8F26_00340, partial [Thiobacillus sp.]|nr:hypothetical protein [Thiobacillus sp.]